jgi:hypothetical protein
MLYYACLFDLQWKVIAFRARTLGGNIDSWLKLIIQHVNIRCRWHAWMKSFKTPPHTGGTCLRQQSRVTLSSAGKIIQSLSWAKGKVAHAAPINKGQGGGAAAPAVPVAPAPLTQSKITNYNQTSITKTKNKHGLL